MAPIELDLHERQVVEEMLHAQASVSTIARKLSRHRSTIYRGIKRNRFVDDEWSALNGYYGKIAQKIAAERRHRRRKLLRCPDLLDAVIEGFEAGWLPEQIAGRIRFEEMPATVCHETIYSWVYSKHGQQENLARGAPCATLSVVAISGGPVGRASRETASSRRIAGFGTVLMKSATARPSAIGKVT